MTQNFFVYIFRFISLTTGHNIPNFAIKVAKFSEIVPKIYINTEIYSSQKGSDDMTLWR